MPREPWTPQLLPLVLHRAPPLCEEDIGRTVRPLVAVLHLAHVRAAGVTMYSRRSEESLPRVPISKFGNEDASCGAAEACVPARPARAEAAAHVRILFASPAAFAGGLQRTSVYPYRRVTSCSNYVTLHSNSKTAKTVEARASDTAQ